MAILYFCKFYSFEDKQGLNSTRNLVGKAEWLRFFETQYDASMRVLLVEDETRIARFVARGLREHSYAVDVVGSGEEALYQAAINSYDLAILDVMIPPPDGFTVCRELRKSGQRMPILMLTARDGVDDRITGLDHGADDYLTKPFEFRELLARLRALLRRTGGLLPAKLVVADLIVDTVGQNVSRDGRAISLTAKEYALLEFLARNAGRVVGRAEIAEHVWDEEFDPFSNLIEVLREPGAPKNRCWFGDTSFKPRVEGPDMCWKASHRQGTRLEQVADGLDFCHRRIEPKVVVAWTENDGHSVVSQLSHQPCRE